MFGRTLPLLIRSLRVEARLVRAHLFRLFFLLIIGILLLFSHLTSVFYGAPGLYFFTTMTFLNFTFITLAGVSFFATAVTEEKEEETLGLLKMAGIGPLVILLGKSTSRLLSAVLLLFIQLPFTLLAITLGGVTLNQVLVSYAALTAYMVLLANVGLLCSVVCRRSTAACALMVLFLLGLFVLPPIGVAAFGVWSSIAESRSAHAIAEAGSAACHWLTEASVLTRLSAVMTTGFNDPPFGVQFVSNLAAAVVCFGLSWLVFERCTRNLAVSTAPARGILPTRASRLRGLRAGRVWRNALAWKDFNFIAGGKFLMLLKFALYGILAATTAWLQYYFSGPFRRFDWGDFGALLAWGAVAFLLIEGSIYASRIFHDEAKWKTLPAVMMLPVSTARLGWSKVAGCLMGLVPASVYFLIGCLLSLDSIFEFVFEALNRGNPGTQLTLVLALSTYGLYYIAFLHLTAFLSLVVKWGALPLAFFLMLIMGQCGGGSMTLLLFAIGGLVFPGGSELMAVLTFGFTDVLIVAGMLILQVAIGARLKTVAAQ